MSDGDLSQFRAGIASRAALLAAGFSQFRIRSALLSGRWQAALPGVVVLHNGPVSANQLRCCALLYAGPASFLSHNTAAYVQGLRVRPTDLVHLTIPHTQHPRSHGFVVVHQSQRPCRLERNGDLRWSEPTRTVLDVAGTLLTRDDVRALVSDAVQRRLVSVAQLEAAVGDVPRRGSRWLRESLEDVGVGTRSMGESRFRRAVRRAGLPEPEWNVPIETAYGKSRTRRPLARGLRRRRDRWGPVASGRRRLGGRSASAERIQASGVLVLRFSVHRLIHDVDGVLDEIRAVLARAIAS